MIIRDIEDIYKVIQEESFFFFYDTVALSHHQFIFDQTGTKFIQHYFTRHHPICLTQTIISETKHEKNAGYQQYFKELPLLMIINEELFPGLLRKVFENEHQVNRWLKKTAVHVFKPINALHNELKQQSRAEDIIAIYHRFFQKNAKNKGEYSLIWLSQIIQLIKPTCHVRFISEDRDLYKLGYYYFLTSPRFEEQLANQGNIGFLSSDVMLASVIRENESIQDIESLCRYYRDPNRKVLYRERISGIEEIITKEKAFSNQSFIEQIRTNKIRIIY
ncbi:hypothetical protein [Sporolactobacillus nakayamae]|uniref:Uncharacterized protein n=1 Tax=Sporolactobacillus nakayamae TaxID=269670 RepID=A0A1I2W2V7_9BACL|nr:hypothetical protein [Sporolactobacillus nakayamae]SFG95720.1 hypothetical protein SAMN02982927_03380 [Sporolactobacillus nakayamae]